MKPQVRLVVFASCNCKPTNTMHILLETEIAFNQMDIGPNSKGPDFDLIAMWYHHWYAWINFSNNSSIRRF